MVALLKVVDEHWGSDRVRVTCPEITLASERVSPREIITQRVVAELDAMKRRSASHDWSRSFLVEGGPQAAEALLNPAPKAKRLPAFDLEKESQRAFEAFRQNRFIMLVDDRQIEDLDHEVTLTPGSEVVFLYLNPLRGG